MVGMAGELPLGEQIRRARGRQRWSQQELADRVKVTRKTVDNWENGRTTPPGATIAAIEDVLGVDLSGDGQADVYTDPDEAALWALDRFPEAERRKLIAALREARARQRAG